MPAGRNQVVLKTATVNMGKSKIRVTFENGLRHERVNSVFCLHFERRIQDASRPDWEVL